MKMRANKKTADQRWEPELEQALRDLRTLLDQRIYSDGGYPADMALIVGCEFIAIADVDYNNEPELSVLSTAKYLKVWRKAKAMAMAAAKQEDEDILCIGDYLYEAGYPEECATELDGPECCVTGLEAFNRKFAQQEANQKK